MEQSLLIFDLDGTLLDTIEDLGHAVNNAMAKNGLPAHPIPDYYHMVGGGVRNLVKRALPENMRGDETVIDTVLADFFTFYRAAIDKFTEPYPGMVNLLEKLQEEGYLLAVASNKFQDGVSALISRFFPGIDFVDVSGNKPEAPLKPSPQIIESIISKCCGPVKSVMIGDSGVDITTARTAGIPVIAVSWGFREREKLAEADAIADDARQLYDLIKTHSTHA